MSTHQGRRGLLIALALLGAAGNLAGSAGGEADPAANAFLAHAGRPAAAIVVGSAADPSSRFAAGELQRYLKQLSGAELPILTDDRVPTGQPIVVVGRAAANRLAAGPEGFAPLAGLKPDGFVLQTTILGGRPALVAAGGDEAGTLYAVYELLERLGVVFQITNDVIPEQKPDLAWPALGLRIEPAIRHRGLMAEHGFCTWYMGLRDYRILIDQMAKLKMNTLWFTWGMGSPFLEFSYRGRVGELVTTPESGYLAWGRESRSWGKSPHSTTGTGKDVRVGREVFPQDYLGAPEFAPVRTPEEARRVARGFLHEVIRYAHQRHIRVDLEMAELSFVPPNLANVSREARTDDEYMYQRFCGVALSPADPLTLDIWDTAMRAMIETYPEADGYGFWTTEHSPDMRDARVRDILRRNADLRAKLPSVAEIRRRGNVMAKSADQLDSDFLQMWLSAQLIQRIKQHHPHAQLNVMTLFRGYKLAVMDQMLPKDVWLGNMEECATTGPVMDFYNGMKGRELFVIPRVSDDGDELHVQFNATEYDEDEIVTGAAKRGLAGVVGQLLHSRNATGNVRYLADGGWNARIRPRSFYQGYGERLYGREALTALLPAFEILEENEKAMVYWGRSEIFMAFEDWSPLKRLRTNVEYRVSPPRVRLAGGERINEAADQRAVEGERPLDRSELVRAIGATWGMGPFWKWRLDLAPQHRADLDFTEGEFYNRRAGECRRALDLLCAARAQVRPGARAELEYLIYKTEGLIGYYGVLSACSEATVALDRAWLGLVDGQRAEFRVRVDQCAAALDRADRLARIGAAQMIAYADEPEEKYLLMRYNRNVLASIERERAYVAKVVDFSREKTP